MTLISALHNLSRSLECALLVAVFDKKLALIFLGGETLLYLVFKLARGDLYYWPRVVSIAGIILSIFERICAKVITDFTGCLHMRHPYELGKV